MKNRPVLILSACLAGEKTRYDGTAKPFCDAASLSEYFDVRIICPEAEAGFGIPREPFHITPEGRAVTNFTGRDLTEQLRQTVEKIADSLADVQPFAAILKSRSPSCGSGYGFFAIELEKRFPGIKIYTESSPEVKDLPGFKELNPEQ